MLSAENVTYRVGNKVLMDDISVDFEPGKLNLIIGPNGAGKSTLIKILCNHIKPNTGAVTLGGKNIQDYTSLELGKIRAVLSQNIDLTFPLKVWEVVMMGRYPHFSMKPAGLDERACEEAMEFFDVSELSERDYTTLSGGEKQRVHFARVLAQIWYPVPGSCRYLIMDEPLTFLDVYFQFQFMHKVLEILKSNDIVVIGVVHDLNLTAKFAHHIVLIHQGKILAKGSKREVFTKEHIEKVYRLSPVIVMDDNNDTLNLFFN